MPSVNRPPDSSASDTALIPRVGAVRVCAGTTADPSSRSVATASAPRVVKASGPWTSAVQQPVNPRRSASRATSMPVRASTPVRGRVKARVGRSATDGSRVGGRSGTVAPHGRTARATPSRPTDLGTNDSTREGADVSRRGRRRGRVGPTVDPPRVGSLVEVTMPATTAPGGHVSRRPTGRGWWSSRRPPSAGQPLPFERAGPWWSAGRPTWVSSPPRGSSCRPRPTSSPTGSSRSSAPPASSAAPPTACPSRWRPRPARRGTERPDRRPDRERQRDRHRLHGGAPRGAGGGGRRSRSPSRCPAGAGGRPGHRGPLEELTERGDPERQFRLGLHLVDDDPGRREQLRRYVLDEQMRRLQRGRLTDVREVGSPGRGFEVSSVGADRATRPVSHRPGARPPFGRLDTLLTGGAGSRVRRWRAPAADVAPFGDARPGGGAPRRSADLPSDRTSADRRGPEGTGRAPREARVHLELYADLTRTSTVRPLSAVHRAGGGHRVDRAERADCGPRRQDLARAAARRQPRGGRLRILRAAAEVGLETVAVAPDDDAGARHLPSPTARSGSRGRRRGLPRRRAAGAGRARHTGASCSTRATASSASGPTSPARARTPGCGSSARHPRCSRWPGTRCARELAARRGARRRRRHGPGRDRRRGAASSRSSAVLRRR
jgi:hypothetical protein